MENEPYVGYSTCKDRLVGNACFLLRTAAASTEAEMYPTQGGTRIG